MAEPFKKDLQYFRFCAYGFLKNLRFFEPFLYLFFLEKGLTFLQIGTLITIREIVRNLFEIPSGILSDTLGRRRTMIASFSMYILSFLVFYFAEGFFPLAGAMLLFAVGDAFRTGTHKAMIFTWLEIHGWTDQKVTYYGHTRSWSQIGSAVSSILAGAFVFWTGTFRTAFLVSVVPYVLDLILMMTYPAVLEGKTVGNKSISFLKNVRGVFKESFQSFRTPNTLKLLMNTSLYSGTFRAVKDYFQPVLAAITATMVAGVPGITPEQATSVVIGVVYFFLYLGTSEASRNASRLSGRFTNLSSALNFSLLGGWGILILAGVFWFLPGTARWSVMIPFILLFLLENIRRPVAVACIAEKLPSNILATTLSVESQTRSLVTAMIAPLLGWIVDITNIGTGLILLGILLVLMQPLIHLRGGKQ